MKIETTLCDFPDCDRKAVGTCVLCAKDGCPGHLDAEFAVAFHSRRGREQAPGPRSNEGYRQPACMPCISLVAHLDSSVLAQIFKDTFDRLLVELRAAYAARALEAGSEPAKK